MEDRIKLLLDRTYDKKGGIRSKSNTIDKLVDKIERFYNEPENCDIYYDDCEIGYMIVELSIHLDMYDILKEELGADDADVKKKARKRLEEWSSGSWGIKDKLLFEEIKYMILKYYLENICLSRGHQFQVYESYDEAEDAVMVSTTDSNKATWHTVQIDGIVVGEAYTYPDDILELIHKSQNSTV